MKTLILLVAVVGVLGCYGQQDSLSFVNAPWKETKVAKGIRLRQCRFDHNLFGSSQYISVLEIKLNKKNRIDVEADPKKLQPTSEFGQMHDAVAAINGTFFDMKNGGSEDYIRMDGVTLNETRQNKQHLRAMHQQAALVCSPHAVRIASWDGSSDWEDKLEGEDVMVTGPLLVSHQQRVKLDTSSFFVMRHPRSAVAIKGKTVLLITADGRNQKAAGMTLAELASVISWLGADDGINLDGGGSTTLWVNHFPDAGVVNYPSDNKKMERSALYTPGMDLDKLPADTQKWDHTGQRPVANVILVNKKK